MMSASLEANTLRIYRTDLEHLCPIFAKKFVTDISPEDIAAYQKQRLAEGYAKKTVSNEVGTLRSVLIYCGQWARVKGEGNQRSSKGRAGIKKQNGKGPTLALYTGSRFGVVRKLKWGNVDFEKRRLRWGKDKSASGDHRYVPLARRALESMRLWAENFPDRQPDHYVFPTERAGGKGFKFGRHGSGAVAVAYNTDPTKPIGSIKTAWKSAQQRSKVACRIHDLRHTAATRMFEAGYELRQVSSIMGWSALQEVRMARIYSHFCTEKNRAAVEAIDLRAAESPEVGGPPKSPTSPEAPLSVQ